MLASRRNRFNAFLTGKPNELHTPLTTNEPTAKVDTGPLKEQDDLPVVDTTNKKKKRNQNDYVRFSLRNRKKEIEI